MTITSTKQARHKPAPRKRSNTKEQTHSTVETIQVDSEPALSKDGDDWYYFWYTEPGKQDRGGSGKSVNCRKFQISWVKEAYETRQLLHEGEHFTRELIRTPNGPTAHCKRFVLNGNYYIEEPIPDDDIPITHSDAFTTLPIVQDDDQDPEPISDPIALETLRRYEIWNACCQAVEIEPTEAQRCEAMRTFESGAIIDSKKR